MSWSALPPELAELARTQFARTGVAMLATVAADGAPRLDPIEPFFVAGELVLGVGVRTAKARRLRRDPRCALHALVDGPDAGEPDVKLHGRVESSDVLAGWWTDRRGDADVYRLVIEEAIAIEWDLAASRMRVCRWRPGAPPTVREQVYP